MPTNTNATPTPPVDAVPPIESAPVVAPASAVYQVIHHMVTFTVFSDKKTSRGDAIMEDRLYRRGEFISDRDLNENVNIARLLDIGAIVKIS